ncbi:6,7-dimethyl-8-ribityllumazine synthase [Flavobacteriaceae bacterium]|jgi:6,7-dimethyl-8-ribityllumazine synthase|nr:6,7-dimethyl-8-ribityllumazine synthase [Flavobacteriaceae bacterium]MDA9317883.1 6,7-dimethyl-8-ribityllumazine synthase [Flavobacteriaceae bacterium]MDB0068805.1 6,7-dimethyl-8-ribityllumazine synthase [Flavobacteriaceae bacterium]MDB4092899.1 6,7-dimethyl-8-ribityllumazine synthase [Flavobacteriaceae bacterium]MDB9849335.1 6,7-dimethyl-8-ribityllumazine synthase [Flavobacteriaceae bacterium]|tara:strand:- start:39 stop:512 length:474 start_codon:yes stop_codon:yes gene_type:complete
MSSSNNNLSFLDLGSIPSSKNLKFGIVVSKWNKQITDNLLKGCLDLLLQKGASKNDIEVIYVPGSFELVYGCKVMQDKSFNAIIAIGSVIKGETKHFDFICNSTSIGIKDLNVSGKSPVIFCVLTDDNLQQSIDRSGGKYGNKGTEAAIAAIEMSLI